MKKDYRKAIERVKFQLSDRKVQLLRVSHELKGKLEELQDNQVVREVFKKASLLTQNQLSEHINAIVTKSIQTVFFDKDITFKAEFVERRNSTECDLYILEDGQRFDLLDDRGHGMADLVSMALRVAYISLDTVDNVLILDEPFRNLDKERQPYASQLIKELSRELNMQFIISTHIPDLVEYADHHIKVSMKKGISYASEQDEIKSNAGKRKKRRVSRAPRSSSSKA